MNTDKQPDIPKIGGNIKIYSVALLGLTATLAIRLLIILHHVEPAWVRGVWYFAVINNLLFFSYRFFISKKRKKVIIERNLEDKISNNLSLTDNDREAILYVLTSVRKSPENFNYLMIFLFSFVAIGLDLWLSS